MAEYRDKIGKLPPEHFENDYPPTPVDKGKGSLYEKISEHIEANKKKPEPEKPA